MADNTDLGQELDWEDEVSDEGAFVLLPAGEYAFEVIKLEKKRFDGSVKMAPCPMAAVTLNIVTDCGWVPLVDRLMLNTKTAWRIARFFEGLGYEKNPETGKVPMAWNDVVGKQGWVKIKVRKYTKKDGSEGESNDVDAYLNPSEWPTQAYRSDQLSMPMPPQPSMQPAEAKHPGWSM